MQAIETTCDQPGRRMSRPALPEYLPRLGLINNSDRFLLGPEALNRLLPLASGDWAGFAYGAEAEYAEYRVEGLRAPLLLINYPTPQITLARLEEMAERFNLNGEGDPNRPLVYLLREGTLLFLLSREGISKEATAALLEDHRYRRDLAWSEPQEIMTDEEWLRTIGGVFVAAGMMTLLVLVFSLAFGWLRYLATRLWPGRIFDRPEDTEILRLHLEEKPQARENP